MNRITFKDTDGTNQYTVPINPVEADIADSTDYSVADVLDGAGINLTSSFDNRKRVLTWDTFEYSDSTFQAMLSELRSYKGLDKLFDLKDIDHAGWGEKTIHVDDVATTILRGGGNLRIQLQVIYRYTEAL